MLEAELTDQLGYEKYEAKGRNSGNSRNGKTGRNLRTSNGDLEIAVPRDRNGDFQSKVLAKRQTSSNELEAKGLSTRDIRTTLKSCKLKAAGKAHESRPRRVQSDHQVPRGSECIPTEVPP